MGEPVELTDRHLAPCGPDQIVARMLGNLKAIYLQSSDFASALPVQRRLAALRSSDPDEQRDLGMLCIQLDQPAEAIAPFQAYLDARPGAPDADPIRRSAPRRPPRGRRLELSETASHLPKRRVFPKKESSSSSRMPKTWIRRPSRFLAPSVSGASRPGGGLFGDMRAEARSPIASPWAWLPGLAHSSGGETNHARLHLESFVMSPDPAPLPRRLCQHGRRFPKIQTVASVGDKPLPVVTGEPAPPFGPTALRLGDVERRRDGSPDASSMRTVSHAQRASPARRGKVDRRQGRRREDRHHGAIHTARGPTGTSYKVIAEYTDDNGDLTGSSEVQAPETNVQISLAPVGGEPSGNQRASARKRVGTVSDRSPIDDDEEAEPVQNPPRRK